MMYFTQAVVYGVFGGGTWEEELHLKRTYDWTIYDDTEALRSTLRVAFRMT